MGRQGDGSADRSLLVQSKIDLRLALTESRMCLVAPVYHGLRRRRTGSHSGLSRRRSNILTRNSRRGHRPLLLTTTTYRRRNEADLFDVPARHLKRANNHIKLEAAPDWRSCCLSLVEGLCIGPALDRDERHKNAHVCVFTQELDGSVGQE